jgi:hypothetical protein
LLIIQLIAFSVGPFRKTPRIDPARTPPDVTKAMSDGLFGASDVRQRHCVASNAAVSALTQLPERQYCLSFLNALIARAEKMDEFI